MKLEIWNARNPTDARRWRAVHAAWPARQVAAHPEYVALFATARDEPLAAYAETAEGFVLYPFLLRPVDAPHLPTDGGPVHDIASPYGSSSGGAFQHRVDEVAAKEFWHLFDDFCRARRVVSEFVRLHLFPAELLPYPGEVRPRLPNVVRDLRPPLEEIWRDVEHKVRKNVNKARRSGVTVEVDETGARLDEFLAVYLDTMRRRRAASDYLFSEGFFRTLVDRLGGQIAFFHARHEGRVVSTELVLRSARELYSFLGGTAADAFDLRPNDLLKFEICRWGREQGTDRFVLGGGYAPDDGIFRYKRSFAPHATLPYCTGQRVFDAPTYRLLTTAHEAEARRRDPGWQPDPGYFPAYRQPLPEPPNPTRS
ncbi:GNAT family N-acetyltransferase [Micromonospora sp. R77]|uniref:lipid II:glycine glycyltransferase FemX n=1 Tax=Micromonospora sp. R77 TaxID=2925836 RepID=UPI001F609C67|nr:GNAT family N-acetyltransferase [Micromonospora sp. R77]MCI4065260.1 GNAT family N-acetyltransferase [Micromonospora sp. R77]